MCIILVLIEDSCTILNILCFWNTETIIKSYASCTNNLRKHSQPTIQPYSGVRLAKCVDAGTEVRPKVRLLEVLNRQVELPGKHVQLFLRDNVLFSFV